jgi:IS30 family transposase
MKDFRELTQRDVSKIARLFNGHPNRHPRERPRKTLDVKTPYEVLELFRNFSF